MRRWLPYVVAAILGVTAALLASCGNSPDSGISASRASDLKSDLDDVRQRVDDARCSALSGQLRQVRTRIDRLPSSVDAQLRQRLDSGYQNLRGAAIDDCNQNREEKDAKTTTTETQTSPEPPPETQPPKKTTTQAPKTTTTPPKTSPSPPAPVPQPNPNPNPGGGTPPELQP